MLLFEIGRSMRSELVCVTEEYESLFSGGGTVCVRKVLLQTCCVNPV